MKNGKLFTAALVGIVILSFQSCKGQEVNVPQAAKAAIEKANPQVQRFTWEKENGNYEGNWTINGKDHSALFTPDGQFVGSETEISASELPAAAREYIAKSKKGKIKEASLNKDATGKITYEADIKGEETLLFDASGNFIKKEISEEGNEKAESNEGTNED